MNPPTPELLSFVAYRMHAIGIGHLALRHASSWDAVPPIKIFFGDKQVIEGKATAFTNGAIEAAIIHSRALLEFVGLKGKSEDKLVERGTARKDDIVIESTGLQRVSIQDAVAGYAGPASEAEHALAHIIHLANKGLAHTSSAFASGEVDLLEIAFRGVPTLMLRYFYDPLGISRPNYEIPSRGAV
jgi:hypothetical protein